MTALAINCRLVKDGEVESIVSPEMCSGYGQLHSTQNKLYPQPYVSITLEGLADMLVHPQQVEKDKAQWLIASTLKSRSANEQRLHGEYWAIWGETDEPKTDLYSMVDNLTSNLGVIELIAYTTKSATEEKQKSRFILPLQTSVNGPTYELMQKAFNQKLIDCNIEPDRANETANQVCYLPNKGQFYRSKSVQGLRLQVVDWQDNIDDLLVENKHQKEAVVKQKQQATQRRIERLSLGNISPIEAFNHSFSVEQLFSQYGYIKRGSRWLSPNSESASPAVQITVEGNRWMSAHQSDVDLQLGKPNDSGKVSGDAFDLFIFYVHGNDRTAALKALGGAFTTADGITLTKSNQRSYMQQKAADEVTVMLDIEPMEDIKQLSKVGIVDDIAKYKAINLLSSTPPPCRYVIDGFLPEPITAAIVAPGSTGKSFYLMQMAACAASGLPFFGCSVSRPGGVLMLSAEDDQDEIARRLHAVRDRLKLNSDLTDEQEKLLGENFYPVTRLADDNRITVKLNGTVDWNSALINSIIRTAKDIPNLRLIILDPVARFRGGDENANEDATKFVEALEKIRKETGVTVLCAHHSRKGGTGESAEDIRGASAFVDALRFAATLYCPSVDDAKKLGIAEEERRSWVRMMVVKSNYKTDVDQQWYRRAEGGVLALTAEPAGRPSKTEDKAEERYLAALPKIKDLVKKADEKGDPITERKFRDYGGVEGVFRMGVGSVTTCVSRALLEGRIHKGDDGKLRLY